MRRIARWAALGVFAAVTLTLLFAAGYVTRDRGNSTSSTSRGQAPVVDDFANLNGIYKLLQDKYVDPSLVDRTALYQAAITGMLRPFPDSGTFYVDPNTVNTSVGPSGTFEGIGATIAAESGRIVISSTIDNSPAQRAGLRAGDVLLEVDGASTQGWTTEETTIKVRGPAGTKVILKLRHGYGREETLDLQRAPINVQSVSRQPPGGSLKDGAGAEVSDVGYIAVSEFTLQTMDELKTALTDVVSSGKKGLVLDLRNDPGGLLQTTVDVADEFLDGGKTILTERERDGAETTFTSHPGGLATTIPVVILLNRFSASGAEVLSAALHDNGRATLVGEKSFGKGTVNVPNSLSDGGQLYVSIAKWLTPNGTQIDGVGIRPDIAVSPSNDDIDAHRDVQLFAALDVLRGTHTTPPADLTPQPTTAATAGNLAP